MNGHLKQNTISVKKEKSKENIMKQKMLDALRLGYEADYKKAKLTLDIYLKKPVAIGEHPQHIEELDKLVSKIADAEDKLKILKEFQ